MCGKHFSCSVSYQLIRRNSSAKLQTGVSSIKLIFFKMDSGCRIVRVPAISFVTLRSFTVKLSMWRHIFVKPHVEELKQTYPDPWGLYNSNNSWDSFDSLSGFQLSSPTWSSECLILFRLIPATWNMPRSLPSESSILTFDSALLYLRGAGISQSVYLLAGRQEFDSKAYKPALRPTQPLSMSNGAVSQGVKRPEREINQ
jgi:hypothetical protein